MSIPFEALNVQLKREIKLELIEIFNKVIIEKRGGYCYELNYLFYSLLNKTGFNSSMVSARIFDNRSYGPEFDHMSIVVRLNEPWLVDVGYGDLFIEPIKIQSKALQEDYFKNYKIEQLTKNKYLLLESLKNKLDFKEKYLFEDKPRKIEDFFDQNIFKQTSPESYFVKNTICTIPTQTGRKTIFNKIYKLRTTNHVEKKEIKKEEELNQLLLNEFNILL